MPALFTARRMREPRYHKDAVEYTSRTSGKTYIVEPDVSGYTITTGGLMIFSDSADRADAMRLIELFDADA